MPEPVVLAHPEALAERMTRTVTNCNTHLERIYPRLTKALANLADWGGLGLSAGGDGGGGSRGSDHSAPTERVAVTVLSREAAAKARKERFERDGFARDHALVVEGLVAAEAALRDVEKRIDRARALWLKGEKPSIKTDSGCYPCSQIKDPATGLEHENGYQKVYTKRTRPKNPEGPKVPYCHWHADFIATWGTEPAEAIVLWRLSHAGGDRIPRELIRDQHPEEWSRVQSERAGKALGRTRLDLRSS